MDQDVRKYNLTWLKSVNAHLIDLASRPMESNIEVKPSRKGDPTLSVDGNQLHSGYDPADEGRKMAAKALETIPEGTAIVVLGLGLGYLAREVKLLRPGPLVVVEADSNILPAAASHGSLGELGDTRLIVGLDAVRAVESLRHFAESYGGWSKIKFISHPPSVRRFPQFYSGLETLASARVSSIIGSLGILVVTPLYGGSLPVAGYCADAFRRLGHRVEILDNSIYDEARRRISTVSKNKLHRAGLNNLLMTLMSETAVAKALDSGVDLVWLVSQSPMSPQAAVELRKAEIPTAFWFVEDWQYMDYWQKFAPQYDYFFTIQDAGFLSALQKAGVAHARQLHLAADPAVHRPMTLSPVELEEFGSDVSHVGAGYRNRRNVFSGLTGFDFKLWGNDWNDPGILRRHLQRDGARISTLDSVKIFNASKVNINLHSSQFHDGVNPDGDYLNPRTFEIASCGGFQLTDRRRDLAGFFERDEEVAVFDDARDLPVLIEHYLSRPEEREQIAGAGLKRVLAEHTYEQRMSEALNFIFSNEKRPASRRHPNHIDNLRNEAKGDEDLLAVLKDFENQGVITLDQIVEHIKERPGDVTRAELIFLLMFEFRRWMAEKDLA